ncbi:hypothetical protein D5086_003507 [Populus alba]|uniref:Uncharacterized protein n=1 Tax=Populus alba TaxID=43335 RepID=A0ACC4D4R8_POPAL
MLSVTKIFVLILVMLRVGRKGRTAAFFPRANMFSTQDVLCNGWIRIRAALSVEILYDDMIPCVLEENRSHSKLEDKRNTITKMASKN